MDVLQLGSNIRLTASERNRLRRAHARRGLAVNEIRSVRDYLAAALGALTAEYQSDLLTFLETGASPLTGPRRPA